MRVYIAGPMSIGNFEANVRQALDAANILLAGGCHPFIPHVNFVLQLTHPQSYERLLEWDFQFIKVCDAVLRLPGESRGADREEIFAVSVDVPVFYSTKTLLEWKRNVLQTQVRELADDVPGVVAPEV